MSLGLMVTNPYNAQRYADFKKSASEVNTADPLFMVKECMDGSKKAAYHDNLIYLLDKVFIADNMRYLSVEQERFMGRYFEEGHTVTEGLNSNVPVDMSDVMQQLDDFLGSYFGVSDDRLVR